MKTPPSFPSKPSPPPQWKQFNVSDDRSYLQATKNVPKEIHVQTEQSWLSYVAIASLRIIFDVFIIKTILKDVEVPFISVSLIGDNRVLISFDSNENLQGFLNLQDSFKEYFMDLKAWNDQCSISRWFLWINVFEIPAEFRTLDFFKEIATECGDFITVVECNLSKSKFDVANILIWTSFEPILSSLQFKVNGKLVCLRVVESFIDVDMVEVDGYAKSVSSND